MKPVDLDLYFNHETETALHVAVRNRSHAIASHLLAAGALPNLNSQVGILCGLEYHVCSIFIHQSLAGSQPSTPGSGEEGSERKSRWGLQGRQASCLVEAASNRDMGMLDLLLKYGARDTGDQALVVAVRSKDHLFMSKLLALKSHEDQESQVNTYSQHNQEKTIY